MRAETEHADANHVAAVKNRRGEQDFARRVDTVAEVAVELIEFLVGEAVADQAEGDDRQLRGSNDFQIVIQFVVDSPEFDR